MANTTFADVLLQVNGQPGSLNNKETCNNLVKDMQEEKQPLVGCAFAVGVNISIAINPDPEALLHVNGNLGRLSFPSSLSTSDSNSNKAPIASLNLEDYYLVQRKFPILF